MQSLKQRSRLLLLAALAVVGVGIIFPAMTFAGRYELPHTASGLCLYGIPTTAGVTITDSQGNVIASYDIPVCYVP